MLKICSRVSSHLAKWLMGISCLFVVLMMVQIVLDFVTTKFFDQPITGTIEIVSNWYMVGLSFLSLAYVQMYREHIIVEIATHAMSERKKDVIDIIVYLVCVVFISVYFWQTFWEALNKTQTGERVTAVSFDIAIWPTRWFVPLGLAAMGFCMLAQILSTFERLGFWRGDVASDAGR